MLTVTARPSADPASAWSLGERQAGDRVSSLGPTVSTADGESPQYPLRRVDAPVTPGEGELDAIAGGWLRLPIPASGDTEAPGNGWADAGESMHPD